MKTTQQNFIQLNFPYGSDDLQIDHMIKDDMKDEQFSIRFRFGSSPKLKPSSALDHRIGSYIRNEKF